LVDSLEEVKLGGDQKQTSENVINIEEKTAKDEKKEPE
jgi:hypothetical protein